MKHLIAIALLAGLVIAAPQKVVVSPNHRFLQYADGTPFFWLGDTGWLMFSKLDRAQTERYLEDRRQKGYNVIQVMVLHTPMMRSAAGAPALVDRNPGKPNVLPGGNDYWSHVDWVLDRAAEKGIYLAMVPAWGSLAKGGQLNMDNVEAHAKFLAQRYRSKPNLFWMVGGDIDASEHLALWKRMGSVLRAEDPEHLITFHPFGRMQSSMWFHEEPWLDFNMFQSGHQDYAQDTKSPNRYGEDNWRYVKADYARKPVKPVVDGEPSYENIPHGLHDRNAPFWNDADCRRYAYWSVFAGAFGHTYGDSAVMQFRQPGQGRASYFPKNNWMEAINDPGAGQMQYLKRLVLSRPYFERVPDQTILAGEMGTRYDAVLATRGASYAFLYSYSGKPFAVRLGAITGRNVQAWWYSPRDGAAQSAGTFPNTGTRTFTPPQAGSDWVLVLDDADRKFSKPGVIGQEKKP